MFSLSCRGRRAKKLLLKVVVGCLWQGQATKTISINTVEQAGQLTPLTYSISIIRRYNGVSLLNLPYLTAQHQNNSCFR